MMENMKKIFLREDDDVYISVDTILQMFESFLVQRDSMIEADERAKILVPGSDAVIVTMVATLLNARYQFLENDDMSQDVETLIKDINGFLDQ